MGSKVIRTYKVYTDYFFFFYLFLVSSYKVFIGFPQSFFSMSGTERQVVWMDGWVGGLMGGLMDGWVDRQVDEWMDG